MMAGMNDGQEVQNSAPLQETLPRMLQKEAVEVSTDEGSDSDPETVSSTSVGSDGERQTSVGSDGDKQGETGSHAQAGNAWAPPGILRLPMLIRSYQPKKQVRFMSTPLSPIPGTPVAVGAQANVDMAASATAPPATMARLPRATITRKPHESSIVAMARHEGLPLRVRLPAAASVLCRQLKHGLPAKKRPPFSDIAAAADAAILAMDAAAPVKKSIPEFLLTMPVKMM
jgi:hypothetical protein